VIETEEGPTQIASGEVVWARPLASWLHEGPHKWEMGIQFICMSSENRRRFEHFVERARIRLEDACFHQALEEAESSESSPPATDHERKPATAYLEMLNRRILAAERRLAELEDRISLLEIREEVQASRRPKLRLLE
jgi:hypothetical protein